VRRVTPGLLVCTLLAQSDSRIPPEVRFKSGYVNPAPKPQDFTSAMLWGIAIADTRVPGFQTATVEIAHTQLTCRADGRDVVLNDDAGNARGGLCRHHPWFGTDANEPMPIEYSDIPTSRKSGEKWGTPTLGTARKLTSRVVVLRVGSRLDRVWHFWAASPRASLPAGHLEGCTVKVKVKISRGALLQIGMDYWRNPTVGYGPGGNNHEAGASDWYFASEAWQEAVFTDAPKQP
jgi:hypothetical protein